MIDERRETILRLKQTGMSYASIGQIFGVSRQRVQQIVGGSACDRCESCGSDMYLQIHHDRYWPFPKVRTLCSSCHGAIHGGAFARNGEPKDGRIEFRTDWMDRARMDWLAEIMDVNKTKVIREAIALFYKFGRGEIPAPEGYVRQN